jgi:fructose/tagatose bisphosphate aldolase
VFAVHLDHDVEATCYDGIESGFYSAVMIDASHEPLEEKVAVTKRVVERAHAKGLSVEAELGRLGGGRRRRASRRGQRLPDRIEITKSGVVVGESMAWSFNEAR